MEFLGSSFLSHAKKMGLEIVATLMFSITSILTKSLGMIVDFLVYLITFGKHRFRSSRVDTTTNSTDATDSRTVFEGKLPELFLKNSQDKKNIFHHGEKTRLVVPTLRIFPYVFLCVCFLSAPLLIQTNTTFRSQNRNQRYCRQTITR